MTKQAGDREIAKLAAEQLVEKHFGKIQQAKCPRCGEWSEVIDALPRFPFAQWEWTDNYGVNCPRCGYLVLFESECDFREVEK